MATTIGTDANDSLLGTTADDVILGGDGNDEIDGRGGGDTLLGGNGDDSVFGGTGNDVLLGEIGDDQLFGLPGDDELRGAEGADILDGGDGDDLLVGGAGADDMDGGAGNDRYSVDDAGDRINEAPGARLGGIDSVSSSVTFTLPDNVERLTLIGVERINGTGNDLQNRISGNDARNVLRGGGGSDVLAGGLGPDYLDGGADADTMVGGGDSDTFIVDDPGDVVQEDALGGIDDHVIASVDFRLPAHVEQLTLRGSAIEGIGNARANILRGNPRANTLLAGAGDDTVLGGSGGDRIIAGAGADTVDGERGDDTVAGGDGDDTLEGGQGNDHVSGDADNDKLYGDSAEDDPLVPGEGGDDALFGGDGRDTLFGGAGNDTLFGGARLDDLFGGAGNDTLFGGASGDMLDGGAGSDMLDGGAGSDFARYEAAASRVVVDLARGFADSGGVRDTLVSIENAIGSAFNDRLVGNGDTNELNGNGGNDVLIGGVGGVSGGTQVRGDGTLVGGLGGTRGFGENVLDRQDDSPSAQVDIRSVFGSDGISFFGHEFTSVFVNNNGNVTFSTAQSTFTPFVITGATSNPIIAPFFADIDTRLPPDGSGEPQPPAGADQVFWDLDTATKTFTVTWDSVGYFNSQTDKLNSFQLQLIDRGGSGDFDIVFRYQSITWTTGNASGGTDGLGGTVARAGYSSGNGFNFFELPAAGNQAAVLALDTAAGNTGKKGLWVFEVRNGIVEGDSDLLTGDAGNDVLVGGLGSDVLTGGEGRDRFDYGSRNEGWDVITDFDPTQDIIDLSRVLSGFVPGASDPEQFLRLVPSQRLDDELHDDTKLQIDFDGGGNSFVDFITLFDRTGLSVNGLVGSGAIDLIA